MTVLQKAMNILNRLDDSKIITLYLIRHGEAKHNIEEKRAAEDTKEQALREGWTPDELQRRMNEARVKALVDPRFFDAPLSDRGVTEAQDCRVRLQALIAAADDLTPPARVLVSPLQRALQTADLIFPNVENIHVREELRERMTGLPCDSRHRSDVLRNRKSFSRFSMTRLQLGSMIQGRMTTPRRAMDDTTFDEENLTADEPARCLDKAVNTRSVTTPAEGEDIEALRKRTKLLFKMLLEFEETSIAVVSHKGYLRELERAQFQIQDSPLFGNGEVRIYQVKLSKRKQRLLEAKRLL